MRNNGAEKESNIIQPIQPESGSLIQPEILIQRAELAIKETVGAILIPKKYAIRIQKIYEEWKKSNPDSSGNAFPSPENLVPAHPFFLESMIKRLKKSLDRQIDPKEDITHILSVRHKNASIFNRALLRAFDEIETDETFDSEFLLQNITEELNRAIKLICDKEKEYKIDEDIEKRYQHFIDNDDLTAFIFNRLLDHREVNMSIRLKDYQKVVRTFAFFRKLFYPIFCKKMGEDKAMMLLELIKKYCDPKTESLTMYNLIAACEAFHRMEESQAGGKN